MQKKLLYILFITLLAVSIVELSYYYYLKYTTSAERPSFLNNELADGIFPTITFSQQKFNEQQYDMVLKSLNSPFVSKAVLQRYWAGIVTDVKLSESENAVILENLSTQEKLLGYSDFLIKFRAIDSRLETGLFYTKEQLGLIKVYRVEANGNRTEIGISDIKKGDEISVNEVIDLKKDFGRDELVSLEILIVS